MEFCVQKVLTGFIQADNVLNTKLIYGGAVSVRTPKRLQSRLETLKEEKGIINLSLYLCSGSTETVRRWIRDHRIPNSKYDTVKSKIDDVWKQRELA